MAGRTLLECATSAAIRWPTLRRGCIGVIFGLCLCLASPCIADDVPDPLFDEEYEDGSFQYPDPLESANRSIFNFNRRLDQWILDPLTKGYRYAVPKSVRAALSRAFLNLGSTKTVVNDFLQLEWKDATLTTTRLVVNTTVGILGLFDAAAKMGLEGHVSDFGQTLALAGVPSGPYLLFPLLGPSNLRDGVGTVTDLFFQPLSYFLGPSDLLFGPSEMLIYGGSSGISTRDRHFSEIKALEESSIDFYAAMRSGYYQQRVDRIWGRREGHRTSEEPHLESLRIADQEADQLVDEPF